MTVIEPQVYDGETKGTWGEDTKEMESVALDVWLDVGMK